MMGAGKSSVGRALAEISGREFLDTDLLLQQRLGRPISQIFQVYGEEAFRDHETNLLKSLQPSASILSTGGGIILREENWEELERLGLTIYLQADLATLAERLENSKKRRPLLDVDDWEERLETLLLQRQNLYERAQLTVNVDNSDVESVAQKVLEVIRCNS